MPYRKIALSVGQHYHIYNRGNNFGDVYFHREDYLLFLGLMRKYLVATGAAELAAYCLMPSHFHLLGLLLTDRISASMQAMMLAYTKTINHKYGRVGALFQGRFKAIRVSEDSYLGILTAYIHQNPVEAGLVREAKQWEFSSCRDYLGLRKGTLVAHAVIGPEGVDRRALGVTELGDLERALVAPISIDGGDVR